MSEATEFWGELNGVKCSGWLECHYCASACDNLYLHDDPPPVIGLRKNLSFALRPSSPYACRACWSWKWKGISVRYMNGELRDRQSPCDHSWVITEKNASAINLNTDKEKLWQFLLKPSLKFILMFTSYKVPEKKELKLTNTLPNSIHLAHLNNFSEIKASTILTFTYDNVPFQYSVYELEEGCKHETDGKMGGVAKLLSLLGPHPTLSTLKDEFGKAGRPMKEEQHDQRVKKTITPARKSG